ncbi:MAG: sugar ABC transporter substrate-binding protein [Aggregatilineales bacterium]
MSQSKFDRRNFLKLGGMLGAGVMSPGLLSFIEYRMANAQSKPITCAMSSAGLAGSWNAQGQAAAQYFSKLMGVTLTWFDGEFDDQKQRAKFDQLSTQKWDFVAVQPNSIGVLADPISTITKAGIPVIDMDTLIAPLDQLKSMGVLTLIAPDNVTMAEQVVTRLVQKMGGKGKIAHTGGAPGHTGAQGRYQGFLNIVKQNPNIQIVDDQPASWNTQKAAEIWQTILNKNPDITGGFCDNDDMALAAQKVVADAGKASQVFIAGIDAMPPAIQAVQAGTMVATARNSANRIHGWAIIVGAYAATVGLDQARKDVPSFILADGPAIYADVDSNAALAATPWKLKAYGMSTAPGQVYLESQFLF